MEISKESKAAFDAAAKKLGLSTELPELGKLRPDLALWLTAKYMLAVIIEADKNGELNDITNHNVRKYEPLFYAEEGYVPGSSGGGFSSDGCGGGHDCSPVGARLSFNSLDVCRKNTKAYLDLWEIAILNVK